MFEDSGSNEPEQQVRYLMRGINGEKLGLKYLNVGKMLIISSLCRVKYKLYLRSKTHGERDYKNSIEEIHLDMPSTK